MENDKDINISINKNSKKISINFLGLLTILFITLKLTNVIDWSWWWVLSPLWLPVVIVLAIIAIVGVVAFCYKKGYESK